MSFQPTFLSSLVSPMSLISRDHLRGGGNLMASGVSPASRDDDDDHLPEALGSEEICT